MNTAQPTIDECCHSDNNSWLAKLPSPKLVVVVLLALLLIMPMIAVLLGSFLPSQGSIDHLANTVLPRYLANAVIMLCGVCALSFSMGTVSAWLVTMYNFPAAKLMRWALVLPLAMPAYVLAMIYGTIFEPAGIIQTSFRDASGLSYGEYPFFDIRSIGGVIIMLSLALYPYIYMLARNAFAQHSCQLLDSAMMLGVGGVSLFTRIAMPVARPALVVGLALVGMETLADFGTVSLFGVESFTTGIYRIWYGMGDIGGAARLASMLLLLVGGMLWIERHSRHKARYHNATASHHPMLAIQLVGWKKWAATFLCIMPVILGFVFPVAMLLNWNISFDIWNDIYMWQALINGLIIAISVVVTAIILAISFAFTLRFHANNKAIKSLIRVASLGYSIPGSVIAVGVMIPLLWFDKQLAAWLQSMGYDVGLLLTGSIIAIVLACTVRFMAVALGSVESSLQAITPMMDDAACCLGCSTEKACWRVHLPMMKSGLIMAGLMLFVDTIKELPATILLRPFNFDTLAIRTYELAADEQLIAAASPALMMVLVSLVPVVMLSRR